MCSEKVRNEKASTVLLVLQFIQQISSVGQVGLPYIVIQVVLCTTPGAPLRETPM